MERLKQIINEMLTDLESIGFLGYTPDAVLEQSVKIYLSEVIQENKKENIKEMKNDKPTEKQISLLKKLKVNNVDKLTKSEATKLINEKLNKGY